MLHVSLISECPRSSFGDDLGGSFRSGGLSDARIKHLSLSCTTWIMGSPTLGIFLFGTFRLGIVA